MNTFESEIRNGNARNDWRRVRSAAFTPLERTHDLGRKNVAGHRTVKRRKRHAPARELLFRTHPLRSSDSKHHKRPNQPKRGECCPLSGERGLG